MADIYQQVAREICAAVAEDMLCLNHAQAYRDGRFDDKRPIGMIKELAAPYGKQEDHMTVHYSNKEDKFWIRDGADGVLWFDSVLEAQDAQRQLVIDAAVAAERAAILAYLRRHGDAPAHLVQGWIAAGEHLAGGDDAQA
jgi:hypothetical protein